MNHTVEILYINIATYPPNKYIFSKVKLANKLNKVKPTKRANITNLIFTPKTRKLPIKITVLLKTYLKAKANFTVKGQ